MSKKPVCDYCNDTHTMTLHRESGQEQEVACTRCPTPCQKCRAGGRGAFCEKTPCACRCHTGPAQERDAVEREIARRAAGRPDIWELAMGERQRLQQHAEFLRTALDALESTLSLPGPVGFEAAQAILSGAGSLAMSIAKLDTLQRHGSK